MSLNKLYLIRQKYINLAMNNRQDKGLQIIFSNITFACSVVRNK